MDGCDDEYEVGEKIVTAQKWWEIHTNVAQTRVMPMEPGKNFFSFRA
jgi:hypothetical protein